MTNDQQRDLDSELTPNILYENICRICLESGEIPIFGGDGKPDLSPEITGFGAIKVCQYDEMPQHICSSCYALLQNAILFRDMAKKSEIAIKYQKTLIAENLCTDKVKSNNSLSSIPFTSPYILDDHNYSRNEAFDIEENSSSRDNYDSESESNSKQRMQEKNEIKTRTYVVSSKTKTSENTATRTSCNICDVNFELPTDYYEHDLTPTHIFNIKKLGRIECDICNVKMNSSYFNRHLLYHTFGPTPVGDKQKCKICDKILLCKADIKIHRESDMHRTALKSVTELECPVCHATVKRVEIKPHLSRHASIISNRFKQKCPICNKIMNYSYYACHLKNRHNIDLVNKNIKASSNAATNLKLSVNRPEKFIEEKNLSVNKENRNKEMIDKEKSCFDYDLEEATANVPEPLSSDEDYHLKNVNIPIEDMRNKTTGNKDSRGNITMIVVSEVKDTENNKIIDNNQIVDTVHSCEMCNMNFLSSNDYYEHIGSSEHMELIDKFRKIECNICNKSIDKVNYVTHIKNHCFKPIPTNGVYTCKICNDISITDVKTHIKSESHKLSENAACQIECALCHMIVERVSLWTHLRHHAYEASCKQKCPICGKYMGFQYYTKHLEQKHNIGKIREVYMDPDIVYKDKNTTKTKKKLQSYCCDQCGKVFQKACNFRTHCLTHGGEMKFKCNFCPYRSITKDLLKTHLKTHLGIYKFKCNDCPKLKFVSKSNLIKHIRTHRGPIDFKCEICHKGFYNKPDLKRHVEVVHLGIKKFVCHICNNKFCYKKGLRVHLRTIHNFTAMKSGRQANYMKAEFNKDKN